MTFVVMFSFLVATLVLQFATIDAVNYCQLHCQGDNYHVGCGPEPSFAPECGQSPRTLDFQEEQKNLILSKLNDLRDQVAQGSWGLPVAARMKVLVWNDQLAYLARRQTKECVANGYPCRNTEQFDFVGQLNYEYSGDNKEPAVKDLIDGVSKLHFQKDNITQEFIESYHYRGPRGNVEELALAISDRVTAVGCGATVWQDGKKAHALLTCNFSSQNSYGKPVYVSGQEPGEKCNKKDEKYENLCSADEPINPNQRE